MIASLAVRDLKTQLEKAEQRENTLISERSKLLDLLSAEKEEKRALMPPADEKPQKSQNDKLAAPSCRCAIVPSNLTFFVKKKERVSSPKN